MPLAGTHADKGDDKFEIYRSDSVRVTSTLFAGGDWHWRLANRASETLAEAGGYRTQKACREAVAVLRERAASARVCEGDLGPE